MVFSGLFGSNKFVALDIGTSSVKLAEIDVTPRGPILRKFSFASLPSGAVQGGEILDVGSVSLAIGELVKSTKSKRKLAITGMWGNAVIVKKIAMPRTDPALVSEQLKWEAEQYIPFDINEISLEHHILSSKATDESMDVLLVAAKQDLLFRFIEAIESARLKCATVDVVGFALANCFEANYGRTDKPVALVNIGGGATNFVVVDRGEVVFSRDLSIGGINFTNEISRGMNVSFQEAESLKISAALRQPVPGEVNSIIASTTEQVVEDIKASFEFYSSTSNGVAASKFYVSGGSVLIPGLAEQISNSIGIPFEPLDPLLRVQYDTKTIQARYIDQIKALSPVVVGLALRSPNDL